MAPTSLKLSAIVFACLMLSAAQANQMESIRKAGRLRVAIINGLPGFSFTQPGQGFIGSDVETARLLAKEMGVKPEFILITNADRISAIKTGRADLIISALSLTPEREREIVLSVPYASIAIVVGAPHDYDISSYNDLRGKTVGTGHNTADGVFLKRKAPGARIVEYDNEPALVEGYLRHHFEVISCQEASLRELNSLLPHDQKLETKFVQTEFKIAIGMRKNEPVLHQWINQWIVRNLIDNRLNEIFQRYHGRPLPESIMPTTSSVH